VPVRTRSLFIGQTTTLGSSATFTLFQCPANRTAIVKEITGSLVAGTSPTTAWLYVQIGGAGTFFQHQEVVFSVNDRPVRAERWLVLEEGDVLHAVQSSNRTVDWTVSGTLLDGDPS
jgi:hypothetical protein